MHRNRDGSVQLKAVPCRRESWSELGGSTGYKETRTIWLAKISGLHPGESFEQGAESRDREGETEWHQGVELKKPVDWEPHTSVAVLARPVEPRRETWGEEPSHNPAAARRMAGSRWCS